MEMLLYLAARARHDQVRRYISTYLTRLRNVKSKLSGRDLQELGLQNGPLFGVVMERLLAARLDGLINSVEDEKNLARSMIESW